jgi:Tol biopolymer transport system component
VVHRDIKPGNILLAEGHATIADFGIARAIEAARADRVTSTGLGVGTPLYASPEQATAQETLDGRTDIYSLGCVLYEMLAGQPPLTGATPQMIQARRVSETPSPLHDLRDTVPPALDHVIARALARIPADRYATASQFAQALQAVLFSATPAAHADLAMTPGPMAMTPTGVVSEPAGKSRRWWLLAIPVLAVALIAVLWPASNWFGDGPIEITTSNNIQVTRDPGIEFQPALSPDGSEVAYIDGQIGDTHVVVRSAIDIGTGGASRPSEAIGGTHWLPSWTADGASLRFWAWWGPGEDNGWKQVGKLGGSVRTVSIPRLSNRYAWSRDGTRVAFAIGQDSIFAFDADGGDSELLGVQSVNPWAPHSLTWSPDGSWIAYVKGNAPWRWGHNVSNSSIWILDSAGGEPIQVTDEMHMNLSPQWLPDSRHLLFVSNRDGPRGLYVVEVGSDGPRGSPRSVPGAADAHSISLSADGRKLAYSKFSAVQNIWSIAIPENGVASIEDAVPVTTGNQVIEVHALSPDGEWIAFDSDIRGDFDIYKRPLTGGQPQLVADIESNAFGPDWSPDGSEIAFYSGTTVGVGGNGEVFVVSEDGGSTQQLTFFPGFDNNPDWSPDGTAIAFQSHGPEGTGSLHVWMVSREGLGTPWSEPVQLTDFPCLAADWDSVGHGLICDAYQEEKIALVSKAGEVVRYDPLAGGLNAFAEPTFSPDGSRIYFIGYDQGRILGVWWMPSGGGPPNKVVALEDPSIVVQPTLTVGPESLYFTFGEYESDIWVMDLDW